MTNEITCAEYTKKYEADKWGTLKTTAKMVAEKHDMGCIADTLADVACEMAQYAIRIANGGETIYKGGSCTDLLKYVALSELWEMVLIEKLDEDKKKLFHTLEADEAHSLHCKHSK